VTFRVLADVTPPNMLDPAGSEAHRLAGVWWLLLILATAVALVVLGLMVVALFRRGDAPDAEVAQGSPERDNRFIVVGGLVMPVIVLAVVAVATITSTAALRQPRAEEVAVEVRGEQWFWRIHYTGTDVESANVIRLPVDRPVALTLRSEDVNHSFWVPSLAGKVDLIPGQTNQLRFTPTKVGRFRGQCAEFCGLQHANMAFEVEVMDARAFDRWLAGRKQPPDTPASAEAREGRRVFASSSCAGCHTVTGVSDGDDGPDLTDFASRRALGAGVTTNTPAHLAQWVRDAPSIKPGANMPPIPLTDQQVRALVAYLESLQ